MRARQSFYFFITGTLKINIFSEKLQIPITLKNECQKEYSKYIFWGGRASKMGKLVFDLVKRKQKFCLILFIFSL